VKRWALCAFALLKRGLADRAEFRELIIGLGIFYIVKRGLT